MKASWERFLKESDIYYNYMINNFNFMINDIPNNFSIIDGIYRYIKDTNKLTEEYGDDIEKELIPWIIKEYEEGRLFNKELWKPFRDQSALLSMYYGYRYLFTYNENIYQLALIDEIDLDKNDKSNKYYCFVLALYGWKEEGSNMLQPYKDSIIPEDNIMPEEHWIYR